MKQVAHAVAVNEHHKGFPVDSIFKQAPSSSTSNRLERGFLGAHSDIGGGYGEGDLSDVALMWIINEARNAGISFVVPTKYTTVSSPIVHDSVKDSLGFTPSREFLWAEQNSNGPKQFISQSHLKFNWANTLQFQADGLTKFQQIQDLTKGNVYTVPEMQAYEKLKAEGAEGKRTILYGNSSTERIKIASYINWLKNKEGYELGSNSNMLD